MSDSAIDQLRGRYPEAAILEPLIILNPERIMLAEGVRIDSYTKLEAGLGLTIGRFVHIASFVHLNVGAGRLVIGDFAAVASRAVVLAGSNQMAAYSMSASAPRHLQSVKQYTTTIEEQGFVGVGAIIMPGVTIGRGAVAGAGALVTRDIPDWEVWGGTPAKFLKKREPILTPPEL